MSKILVVGNVLKDVYLKLDERQNNFEHDDRNVAWLDLSFDGQVNRYFRRTSTFGGAAVSLSTFVNLGVSSSIANYRTDITDKNIQWLDPVADYRYIFSNDDKPSYFIPSARTSTKWQTPDTPPQWVFVDRSTTMSEKLADAIVKYLRKNPATRLAIHIPKHTTPSFLKLIPIAKLIFLEESASSTSEDINWIKQHLNRSIKASICYLGDETIKLGAAEEFWSYDRVNLMTHLTAYSIIAATILGIITLGGNFAEALLWAQLNLKLSSLDDSPSFDHLSSLVKNELGRRAALPQIAKTYLYSIPASHRYSPASKFSLKKAQEDPENILTSLSSTYTRDNKIVAKIQDPNIPLCSLYGSGYRMTRLSAVFSTNETLTNAKEGDSSSISSKIDSIISFAKKSQLASLVPIIEIHLDSSEPRSLISATESYTRILSELVAKLAQKNVALESVIIECDPVSSNNPLMNQSSQNNSINRENTSSESTVGPTSTSPLATTRILQNNPAMIEYATNAVLSATIPANLNCVLMPSNI